MIFKPGKFYRITTTSLTLNKLYDEDQINLDKNQLLFCVEIITDPYYNDDDIIFYSNMTFYFDYQGTIQNYLKEI